GAGRETRAWLGRRRGLGSRPLSMDKPTPPAHDWFSPGQRKFIALAVVGVAAVALGGVVFLAGWMLGQFLTAFAHVLIPLAVAAILAMLLRPVVNRIETKLKLPRVRAILLLYFLVVAVCIFFGLLLLPLLASQVIELGHTLPDSIRDAVEHLK